MLAYSCRIPMLYTCTGHYANHFSMHDAINRIRLQMEWQERLCEIEHKALSLTGAQLIPSLLLSLLLVFLFFFFLFLNLYYIACLVFTPIICRLHSIGHDCKNFSSNSIEWQSRALWRHQIQWIILSVIGFTSFCRLMS